MTVFTALTRASYKANTRDGVTIFFTFAFPLIFLVIFGLIFRGQQVDETGNGYIDFIAPGILSWGLANSATFGVAFQLMQWRRDDLLRLIRLTPAAMSEVVLSRLVMAVVIGLVQMILFIGIASLPLFGMNLSDRWPMALPILLLGVATFLGLGLIIGAVSRSAEAVSAIGNCVVIPMAFLSGAMVPVELFPGWLADVSKAMPLKYILDGFVYSLAGAGEASDYWIACGVLVALTAVFTAIGMRLFKWSDDE